MKTFFVVILCFIHVHSQKVYRLRTDVKPSHYEITIEPDLAGNTFVGRVQIYLNVENEQDNITLHSLSLNISEILLNGAPTKFILDEEKQFLHVFPVDAKTVIKGGYNLTINYVGTINAEPDLGLWKTTPPGVESTEDEFMIVSDFEPAGARRVFPCFDEPYFKAQFTFNIKLKNESYFALTNMPLKSDSRVAEGLYEFKTSFLMSSYLVCIIVTNVQHVEQKMGDLKLRIFSKDKGQEGQFAVAEDAINWFTNYLNQTQPLEKLDLIDYNKPVAGTENWGLVTLKAGILSTSLNRYDDFQINSTLIHEMGHSWIGNLVTIRWWDHIWLQEGLDTFLTEESLFDISQQSYKHHNYVKESIDELVGVIQQPLETYQEIRATFNDISYSKASFVFRTIQSVDPNFFKTALRKYINTFKYKTVTTDDFISIFESLNPKMPWREFILSYIHQKYYPLINIKKLDNQFVLTQECWALDKEKCAGLKWTIPIRYILDNNTEKLVWFYKNQSEVIIPAQEAQLIRINSNPIKGYYRYNYDEHLWSVLLDAFANFTEEQQNDVMSEMDLLYHAGLRNCSFSFNLFQKTKQREWYFLWRDLIQTQDNQTQNLINEIVYRTFKKKLRFYNKDEPTPERLIKCFDWMKESTKPQPKDTNNV